ncbi:MAG: exopolysaccharide biosynthesis polyprenyl glycosylphosphotransferase [Lachnospiraceae bacterium]|nr:exopolysaccharide biosynthesis polyprenyl glycosylphosphotransferase [Lachnospiraceae bacterium]
MRKMESVKRLVVLQLTTIGLLLQIAAYGIMWYRYYADAIKLVFWNRGNWLVIALYAILLLFFTSTYGGTKIGYLKPLDVFLSQVFALLMVNVFTYAQVSLMCEWFADTRPMLLLTGVQIVFAFIWTFCADMFYKMVFPPRELLLIHGERPIEDIKMKFAGRSDRYQIVNCINISEGIEAVKKEAEQRYGGVILWDIPTNTRNTLLKHFYSQSIRVYMMPKIPDVIIMGSEKMHLFDTPILLTREYALTVEQRIIKRCIDLFCAIILLILASPVMLVTAIVIKISDGGPVFYSQIRCTAGNKEFKILKFRSMRVDAEKNGKARLASKGDPRITPVGRFIRAVRIDELPQLLNIIKGDMSFIGPRPERPEIIKQYLEEMPEFAFRTKVKAGLAGYAQVYGKYNTTPYDKLKLDLTYIENYSVWLDLKLMLLTLKVLITPDSTEGVEANQVTALKNEEKSDASDEENDSE